jgi:DNA adenine methylase
MYESGWGYTDDIDRALKFYYILKLSFGGKLSHNDRKFIVPNDGRKSINYDKFPDEFYELHERIRDVYIECKDFTYILEKYDRDDSLFFLDPPYYKTSRNDYGIEFGKEQYNILHDKLTTLRGKFILTCSDRDEIRQLFSNFIISSSKVHYSICGTSEACKGYDELIITNFNPGLYE